MVTSGAGGGSLQERRSQELCRSASVIREALDQDRGDGDSRSIVGAGAIPSLEHAAFKGP